MPPTHIHEAASYLLAVRTDRAGRTPGLPEAARPQTQADAYEIQAAVMAALGPIGGWKVGSPAPAGDAFTCAPLPASGVIPSPAALSGTDRAIEAEIAVRIGRDLPPREAPYTAAEIAAAIASAHPAIEVLESRFADPDAVEPMSGLADSLGHHSLVVGPAIPGWERLTLDQEEVAVLIDGQEIKRRRGNPGGDMTRLLLWLANTGARWAGGLRAGQVVTTGSWTGKDVAPPGAEARIRFTHAGEAAVRFAR